MCHRLNSYKTMALQCHDESHSNSSSSHVQLELYHASGKLREKSSVLMRLGVRWVSRGRTRSFIYAILNQYIQSTDMLITCTTSRIAIEY